MKKKLHLILFCILIPLLSTGQNRYKPFKVDAGILLGEIMHYDAGIIFPYLEPKYNLTNNVSLGLRTEFVFLQKEFENETNPYWNNLDSDGQVFSLLATTDRYFTDFKVRPFIGGGAGYFLVNSSHKNNFLNVSEKNLNTGGLMVRCGINFGQFKFSTEYNHVFSSKVNINYFSLKLGYEIGGGKRILF